MGEKKREFGVMLQAREATEEEVAKTGLIHRVYQPEDAAGQGKRPMVVLVHGRAGNASVMWFFSKAFSAMKPVIVSPQAPEAEPDGGFSWWKTAAVPRDQDRRSVDEKFLDAKQVSDRLQQFVFAAIDLYGGDKDNLVAAGFSQGSGVAATLSLLQPGLFRGVAILSGFIPKAVIDSAEKLSNGHGKVTRYFVAHGTKDEIIPISRAEETVTWLKSRSLPVEFHKEEVAHKVGTKGVAAFTSWYKSVAA